MQRSTDITVTRVKRILKELGFKGYSTVTSKTKEQWLKKIIDEYEKRGNACISFCSEDYTVEENSGYLCGGKKILISSEKKKLKPTQEQVKILKFIDRKAT